MAEVKNTERKDEMKVALGVVVGVDELVEKNISFRLLQAEPRSGGEDEKGDEGRKER